MPRVSPVVDVAARSLDLPLPFSCSCTPDGLGTVRVRLAGELDLSTLPQFRETLRQAQSIAATVSLDLQQLAFIDCAALTAIADADLLARRDGKRLIVVGSSGQVDRVLRLTGVLDQFEISS